MARKLKDLRPSQPPQQLDDAGDIENNALDDFSSALEDMSELNLPDSLSVYTLTDADDAASFLSTTLDTDSTPEHTELDSPTEISPITRAITSSSLITVLPSAQIVRTSLRELCVLISSHRSLETANIVSAEGYGMLTNAVLHRFLLLELRREGKRGIWLRLDRLRGRKGSMFKFLTSGGVSDANDTAQLSTNKRDLLSLSCWQESAQVFSNTPTLGHLSHLFHIINDELRRYQLWPANCWFFVSLLQQHLGLTGEGIFIKGALPHPTLAKEIRRRIQSRLQASMASVADAEVTPKTLTQQLHYLRGQYPETQEVTLALDHSLAWDTLNPKDISGLLRLIRSILDLERQNDVVKDDLLGLTSHLINELQETTIFTGYQPRIPLIEYARLYRCHGSLLSEAGEFEHAMNAFESALLEYQQLDIDEHGVFLEEYMDILSKHIYTLRLLDRSSDALRFMKLLIPLERGVYAPTNDVLLRRLEQYGNLLEKEGLLDEAVDLWLEIVDTLKFALAKDSGTSTNVLALQLELVRYLRRYAEALFRTASLSLPIQAHSHPPPSSFVPDSNSTRSNGCDAVLEACRVYRSIHHDSPPASKLPSNLRSLALLLSSNSLHQHAVAIWVEVVGLYKELYAAEPSLHRFDLTRALGEYCGDLLSLSHFEQAAGVAVDVIQINQELYEKHPNLYANNLARALAWYADVLMRGDAGRILEGGEVIFTAACRAWDQSLELYRGLFTSEAIYQATLTTVLADYASALLRSSFSSQFSFQRNASYESHPSPLSRAPESVEETRAKGTAMALEAIQLCGRIGWTHDIKEHERLREAMRGLEKAALTCGELNISSQAAQHVGRLQGVNANKGVS